MKIAMEVFIVATILLLAAGSVVFWQLVIARRTVADLTDEVGQIVEVQRKLAIAAYDGGDALRQRLLEFAEECLAGVDGAAILDLDERVLVCTAARGQRYERFIGLRESVDAPTLAAAALRAGEVVPLGGGLKPIHPGDMTAFAVPLSADGPPRSVLYVASSRKEPWGAADARRLNDLCTLAGPAYFLARDREEVSRNARVDLKSGCLGQTVFPEMLDAEIARLKTSPSARISVVYIDADHFKTWNDRYGHACGDLLITRLGRLYRGLLPSASDFVGRLGGDEFAIALVDVDKPTAIRIAGTYLQALRDDDRSDILPLGIESPVRITGSIGVATYPHDAKSGKDLIAAADRAMFSSKAGGRDRVSYLTASGEILTLSEADLREQFADARDGKERRTAPVRRLRVLS